MQEIVLLIVTVVVVGGVFALLMYMNYKKNNPDKKLGKNKTAPRQQGASRATGPLANFARANQFRLIAPAHFVRGSAKAKLDGLVVGYFGVLGVIALGYNGEIYGTPEDETWVQVGPDGVRNTFKNPVDEASEAVRAVRDALFEAKMKKIPVEVVYVFTDPSVQLALPRSLAPLRVKDFKDLLRRDKYMEDCGLDMDKVEAALKAAAAPEEK